MYTGQKDITTINCQWHEQKTRLHPGGFFYVFMISRAMNQHSLSNLLMAREAAAKPKVAVTPENEP
jgi:hypothetical protein